MTKKTEISDLQDEKKYRLILELPFHNIPDFVLQYMFRKNPATLFYYACTILFFILTIKISIGFFSADPGFLMILLYAFYGLVMFPVLLMPIHEGIHALAFFLSGARKIIIKAEWKHFFFYVTTDRFPVGRKVFTRTAVAPFLAVSAGLWIAAWLTRGDLSWSLYLTLFVHATMCSGDFAMLSFYDENRTHEIITYDDVDSKTAFFYIPTEEEADD